MANVTFIVSDSDQSMAKSLALATEEFRDAPCALHVGDLISYPAAPNVAFRVTERWLRTASADKEAVWYLKLEYAGDPLASHGPLL